MTVLEQFEYSMHLSFTNLWIHLRNVLKNGGCLRGAEIPRAGSWAPKVIHSFQRKPHIMDIMDVSKMGSFEFTRTGALFDTGLSISEQRKHICRCLFLQKGETWCVCWSDCNTPTSRPQNSSASCPTCSLFVIFILERNWCRSYSQ